MYRIGEFSRLSKTTIKALRYYEKENILIPSFVDKETGYRYYETDQLINLGKIISLRQIGMSINNIKNILNGDNIDEKLLLRKREIENEISIYSDQLSRINYLLGGRNMEYEVIKKELPNYTIYYKQGIIEDFSKIVGFILQSGDECRKLNPDLKCIEPDYCYVSYLDGEYKDKDISVMYAQAVIKEGIGNDSIKFKQLDPIEAVCVYHKGSYENIRSAYTYLINWVEENGYEIAEPIRERYIDGMWNKENVEDWLTEIQIPVKKK